METYTVQIGEQVVQLQRIPSLRRVMVQYSRRKKRDSARVIEGEGTLRD